MVMYDNEFETKENKNQTKDKMGGPEALITAHRIGLENNR